MIGVRNNCNTCFYLYHNMWLLFIFKCGCQAYAKPSMLMFRFIISYGYLLKRLFIGNAMNLCRNVSHSTNVFGTSNHSLSSESSRVFGKKGLCFSNTGSALWNALPTHLYLIADHLGKHFKLIIFLLSDLVVQQEYQQQGVIFLVIARIMKQINKCVSM